MECHQRLFNRCCIVCTHVVRRLNDDGLRFETRRVAAAKQGSGPARRLLHGLVVSMSERASHFMLVWGLLLTSMAVEWWQFSVIWKKSCAKLSQVSPLSVITCSWVLLFFRLVTYFFPGSIMRLMEISRMCQQPAMFTVKPRFAGKRLQDAAEAFE